MTDTTEARTDLAATPAADTDWRDMTWMDSALCAQTDPDAFHPERGGSVRSAKAICRRCTSRVQCLGYALDNRFDTGVWGGMSEKERESLRRKARASRADTAA